MARRGRVSPPGQGRRTPQILLAIAVTVLALAGCGGLSADAPVRGDATTAGGADGFEAGLTRWAARDRPPLPPLSGLTLDGRRLDVAAWRGNVIVINTWGSWCAPCRKEAPDLARVWAATKAERVRFVGINTRDNDAAARAFTARYRIGYPSLIDRNGELLVAFARMIPVSAVPTTIVVDPAGRVAARVIGAITAATLRGLIDDLRAERAAGRAPRKLR